MMRWEKITSFDQEFARPRGLRIPGESVYRSLFKRARPSEKCVIPEAIYGTVFFKFKVYSNYVIRRQHSREQWEAFRLYKDWLLARYAKGEGEDPLEKLLVLFWRVQRIMNPAAVKPHGEEADTLQQDFDAMKPVFEDPAGLKITPMD